MHDDLHPVIRDVAMRARSSAALRGDDALMRAATEVAAPRRRLLAGLRDAHAETCARIQALRGCVCVPARVPHPLRIVLTRLLQDAEEQLRRVEIVLAHLRERPAGATGRTAEPASAVAQGRPGRHDAVLALLAAEERHGTRETMALRTLAQLAGQHLAARLLDLTIEERAAAARCLAGLAGRDTRHDLRAAHRA
jgi:ferritin-like metal-binding protein YciE